MVLRKRQKPNSQILDLHGVKHKDVPRKVWQFVEDHVAWGYECILTIITGHSEKMHKIVNRELAEYGLHSRKSSKGAQLKVDMDGWRD